MRALFPRFFVGILLLPSVLCAQVAGEDGPISRDVTTALNAELALDCKSPTGAAIPNCTRGQPLKVTVNGQLLNPDMPPIILDGRTWVEASSLLSALGHEKIEWSNETKRVKATRSDFVLELTLGSRTVHREVNGYRPLAIRLDAGSHPFVSTPRSKTMIPLSAVADLTGAEVTWIAATRTAAITRGTPYFYDRKPDGSGADIMFTHLRFRGPGAQSECALGTSFDWRTRYCVDSSNRAIGNFPELYRARARELGLAEANSNVWPVEKLLEVIDTAGSRGRDTASVVAEMQSHVEIFGLPYDNHDISTPGMFSVTGGNTRTFTRSEAVLPPFVMSGRRQTDQMVRTLYAMMPVATRESTAFLLPDRVAQNPEAYLPYIRSKSRAVLIGSFKGARDISSTSDRLYAALMTRHQRELFKLRTTLALCNSLNVPVVDVQYGMGDSKNSFADGIRNTLQQRFDRTLSAAGFGNLVGNQASKLSWGADELPAIAFARQLPSYKIYVYSSNSKAKHVWDALKTTDVVINEKLASMNVVSVSTAAQADLEVYVLNREASIGSKIDSALPSPDACPSNVSGAPVMCKTTSGASCVAGTSGCRRTYTDDSRFSDRTYTADRPGWTADNDAQAAHDRAFVDLLARIPAERRARSIIVDARVPNGAWNKTGAPTSSDWLVYSAWGTFANNFGLAVAQGKILHHARTNSTINVSSNARRMLLEAIAHDVYANGYFEGQKVSFQTDHSSFREKLEATGVSFVHQMGYSADHTHAVFSLLNTHVNERMRAHLALPAGTQFHISAQFWRTFETEVHMYPVPAGELLIPGLYRTGTVPGTNKPMSTVLSPLHAKTSSDVVTPLTLRTLLGLDAGVR